jgi:hypothetical protein
VLPEPAAMGLGSTDPEHTRALDRFDIRAWRARHRLPERITNPAVVQSVVALLQGNLTARVAASEEQSLRNQDRTERRSAKSTGPADALTA